MDTNPTKGILSNFAKLQVPSNKQEKPKGNGMMNRSKASYTDISKKEEEPIIRMKRLQMYIASKNPKRGGMNESV